MKKQQNKRPSIQKKPASFDFSEFEKSSMDLPEDIAKELKEKGLKPRWVNINSMKQYGGRHKRGWVPYKVEKTRDEIDLFGSGPSEYFQRGDLVLAVKKDEAARKHKAFLQYKAKQSSVKEMLKAKKKQFRDEIRGQGLEDSLKVVDGYDE